MPADKYRFVSPGIQFREIDQSRLPDEPQAMGPVVIGRSLRGPALRPIKVNSYQEFVNIFGDPNPGITPGDVWRQGTMGLAPTFGAYAAQAWLRNSQPLTFVRLLGQKNGVQTDNTTTALAGWKIGAGFLGASPGLGGAYGLFLIDSGAYAGTTSGTMAGFGTGTLAAVFYLKDGAGSMAVSGWSTPGTIAATNTEYEPACNTSAMILNPTAGPSFTIAHVTGTSGFPSTAAGSTNYSVKKTYNFTFNESDGNFIRKVFNTNPTKLNTYLYSTTYTEEDGGAADLILGESFERNVAQKIKNSGAKEVWGVMLGLENASTDWNTNKTDSAPAQTNWIVAQAEDASGSYNPELQRNLFQVIARDAGSWAQKNLKISLTDIRYSNEPSNPYGTFTLLVRKASDSDTDLKILESYANVNLNPFSVNYIARRIGDRYAKWDDSENRYRYYGVYDNISRYIYIKAAEAVAEGGMPGELIPFGYKSAIAPINWSAVTGGTGPSTPGDPSSYIGTPFVVGSGTMHYSPAVEMNTWISCSTAQQATFEFPRSEVRLDTSVGNFSDRTNAYWGFDTNRSGSIQPSQYYFDTELGLPDGYRTSTGPTLSPNAGVTKYGYIFSLENVTLHSGSLNIAAGQVQNRNVYVNSTPSLTTAYYLSGSRQLGLSLSTSSSLGTGSYKITLDEGFDKFTIPLHGGFDGVDITQIEPFNNYDMTDKNQYSSYVYNSILTAINSVSEPESADYNLLVAPGVTNTGLTDRMLEVTQQRGDSLAVIDIEGGYKPKSDRGSATQNDYDAQARGSAGSTVAKIRSRQINNSYGACYYPWVQIKDSATGRIFFAPPTVAALGTYSYSDAVSEVWFAPAGFSRGGLTNGAAGITVVGVSDRITAKQRDQLYELGVNPIATFPAEGVVIYGQKTLQGVRSATDRINVRRLLIHIKKRISQIANDLLFDPNLKVTWDRFTGQVEPMLESVQARFGLEDYKVVLDETTTTPDLVDRNVMYAKIFLKPARAIEYIAVDFIITNTGASFED